MTVRIRERALDGGKVSLYLDIYHLGKREYEFLKLHLLPRTQKNRQSNKQVMELAEQIRLKRELELVSSAHGITSKVKKQIDLHTYFEQVIKIKTESEGLREPDQYKYALGHIRKYTGNKVVPVSQIDKKFMEGFKAYLAKQMQFSTANGTLGKVKTVLKRAYREGLLQVDPTIGLKNFDAPEAQREFLTGQEVVKLANTEAKNEQVKLAFLFSCYTGLRYSDICRLTWENVKGDKLAIIRQQKTQTMNYLNLNKTALNILSKMRSEKVIPLPSQKVFPNIPDKSHLSKHIAEWVNKAELDKKITFHCGRHTFATMAITQGVDLYTVKELLGHKDISVTQKYAKIVNEKRQQAVDSFPEIAF